MKKIVFLMILTLCFLFFGCGSYKEISEVRSVTAIAVDVGTEEIPYTVSFEVVDRPETKGGPSRAVTISSQGMTILEAMRKTIQISTEKLFFGHCNVVIFGEELSQRGLGGVFDIFLRDPEINYNIDLFVAKGMKASEILTKTTYITNVAAYEIQETIRNDEEYSSTSRQVPLYKAYQELNCHGVELTLPALNLTTVMNKQAFELDGLAIFKDDKLQEYLPGESVKYYLLIRGLLKGGVIPIDFKEHGYMTFKIEKLNGNTGFQFSDEKETVKIDVKGVGFINENQSDLDSQKITYKGVEKALELQLENSIRDFYHQYIDSGQPDVLGLGGILYKFHYRTWENHQNDFPEYIKHFDVEVTVDITIENSGLGDI